MMGSIENIWNEKGNIPLPKVLTGLLLPSLRLSESMNPICRIEPASNCTSSSFVTGLGPHDGFKEENGMVISSSPSSMFFVGISHCHDGLLFDGPNEDRVPSDKSNLYVFPSPRNRSRMAVASCERPSERGDRMEQKPPPFVLIWPVKCSDPSSKKACNVSLCPPMTPSSSRCHLRGVCWSRMFRAGMAFLSSSARSYFMIRTA